MKRCRTCKRKPINKGTINGNTYSIEVKEYEDEVILTKTGSK